MSERLADEQVAWYAGTSRTAKWTADMAVHENIITLAREVQAHRYGAAICCAPWRDAEVRGWLWYCSLPLGHDGHHRCIGATW